MADDRKTDDQTKSKTIKTQLRKAFEAKASEDLPEELLSLIGKLREQDDRNDR